MPAIVRVLVPWAENPGGAAAMGLAPRLSSLDGSTIGIVDNGWHCMHIITDLLSEVFVKSYGVAEVVVKPTSGSLTMSEEARSDLEKRCDAVVVGIGTCGSCTRWVLEDAVTLEKSGVPTVSLYTSAFEVLARTLANSEGMDDLHRTVFPHPLNSLPDAQIRLAAEAQLGSLVSGLIASLVSA